MPMMPMAVRASFTSSSLNGLMIASIFLIADLPGAGSRNAHATPRHPGTPTKSRRSGDAIPTGRPHHAYEMSNLHDMHAFRARGNRAGAGEEHLGTGERLSG